jgi:hypothetical protein
MNRSCRLDPVAMFAFALRESDWVLADLIASSLAGRPATRSLLQAAAARAARARASPASLSELSGWAELSRALGIGDGEVAGNDQTQD